MNIDFEQLSKYYKLPMSAGDMSEIWSNGIPKSVFDRIGGKNISDIQDGLINLVKSFHIANQYNEILYLILSYGIEYIERFQYLIEENSKLKRRIAFAKLLLTINDKDSEFDVIFNIKLGKTKVKLHDAGISDIVKSVLMEGLTLNNTPFFHLGLDFLESVMDTNGLNLSALSRVANSKIVKEDVLRNQLMTQLPLEFCLSLLPYIKGETGLSNSGNINFSNQQLSFLYEVCKLLKYEPYNQKQFDYKYYEAPDYLRNALIKYVKKLKSKRNQNRFAFKV